MEHCNFLEACPSACQENPSPLLLPLTLINSQQTATEPYPETNQ
jgi:hypothetical protein